MIDDRSFAVHVPAAFDPGCLRDVRTFMDSVEEPLNRRPETNHERSIIASGASSNKLRSMPEWFSVWRTTSIAMSMFLDRWRWAAFPPIVRHVKKTEHFVPWHQDAAYQRILGPRGHRKVITCFVPLDEEPFERSTIQFDLNPKNIKIPHIPIGLHGAGIPDHRPTKIGKFDLDLGDALIFGDLAIHRTFAPPNCDDERRSLEFRIVNPENSIDQKDYYDVVRGTYVRKDGSTRPRPWV